MEKITDVVASFANSIIKPIEIQSGFDQLDKLTRGFRRSELTVVAARPSVGKAQPLSSKILTPCGWQLMGSLRVGDIVFDKNGNQTQILAIFPQNKRKIYKVTMSDGSQTECDVEHLWAVQSRNDREETKVKSLKEIQKNLKRNNYSVQRCKPILFSQKSQPIDAWLLGFYIGDGFCKNNSPMFVIANKKNRTKSYLLQKVKEKLPNSCKLNSCNDKKGIEFRVIYRKRKKIPNEFYSQLYCLGLSDRKSYDKFIPLTYLYGSVEQRKNLLQGLLDGDGHKITNNRYEYSTLSRRLAEEVKFLVKSLGGDCNYTSRGKYKKNNKIIFTQINYRIFLSLQNVRPHYIDKIEYIGDKECQCILVDSSSHTYITDDFIVTHNTALMLDFAKATSSKFSTAIFSLEQVTEQLIDRMFVSEQQVTLYDLQNGTVKLSEKTIEKLKKYNLFFDDNPKISSKYIWDILETTSFDVIFVDYLNLFSDAKTMLARHREIGEVTKQLRNIARIKNIAVIVLCQLNRNLEQRQDKRPRLADIRSSGEIEQIADNIILIYRPSYYKIFEEGDVTAKDDWEAELIVAKNRNGPVGKIPVVFRPPLMSFVQPNWVLEENGGF